MSGVNGVLDSWKTIATMSLPEKKTIYHWTQNINIVDRIIILGIMVYYYITQQLKRIDEKFINRIRFKFIHTV